MTLVGLTSGPSSRQAAEPVGDGSLEVLRIHRRTYKKQKFVARLVWTVVSNVLLLARSFQRHAAGGCGSLYRQSAADGAFHRATQSPAQEAAHLSHHGLSSGVPDRRARTQRTDSSPAACVSRGSGDVVSMRSKCWASIRPGDLRRAELRRSGSASSATLPPWHSHRGLSLYRCRMSCGADAGSSFTRAIGALPTMRTRSSKRTREYFLQSKHGLRFWLNATGAKADRVERELRSRGVPIYRSSLVPLEDLPRLLLAADVHLITLRDPFVGYVLPSKIHACIESGKRILFVGSQNFGRPPPGQPCAAIRQVSSGRCGRRGRTRGCAARDGARGHD